MVRLGIVGCGAIAQTHARAIAALPEVELGALFDVDGKRAAAFQKARAPRATVVADLAALANHCEAAIVCAPNRDHAAITLKLLQANLHVLCEKPLALSVADAQQLIDTAQQKSRVLACGLVRRFFSNTRLVSDVLAHGLLGKALSVDIRQSVQNWPFSRGSFDRAVSGGGVFIDMAPHLIDLLECWFGALELVEYRDDQSGGVEAVAEAKLRARSTSEKPVDIFIQLCRAHGLKSRALIVCERGSISMSLHQTASIDLRINGKDGQPPLLATSTGDATDPFLAQMSNFVAAINGIAAATVPATVALPSMKIIEAAYKERRPLIPTWEAPTTIRLETVSWPYQRILLTGATGAIGSRLVEMWAARGLLPRLRCLTRSFAHAARLMRFDVELAPGDLSDEAAVLAAARGCDAIIHLGVGERAERETQNVVAAALQHGIKRVVHMSTAVVYGTRLPRTLESRQELTPLAPTGEAYADAKMKAERILLTMGKSLEAIILRPHIPYGPGLRWSGQLYQLLSEGRLPIVDDGGVCNLIHVDDLVRAIEAGLATHHGFHEPLFITDGAPLSWQHYIEAHAQLLSMTPPHIARATVETHDRTLRDYVVDSARPMAAVLRSDAFRSFVLTSPLMQDTVFRAYLGARRLPWLRSYLERARGGGSNSPVTGAPQFDSQWTAVQLSEARLSSERAAARIGFRAQIGFAEALQQLKHYFAEFAIGQSDT